MATLDCERLDNISNVFVWVLFRKRKKIQICAASYHDVIAAAGKMSTR